MNNEPAVNLSMNRKGAEIWADMTRKASLEVNEAEGRTAGFIAIVLDEKVISAPRSANEITGGGTQISASMDVQEARVIYQTSLTAGKLDAQVKLPQVTLSDQLLVSVLCAVVLCLLPLEWVLLLSSCFSITVVQV